MITVNTPRWAVLGVPDEAYAVLAGALEGAVPDAVLRILAQRGISTPEEAEEFLDPKLANLSDPFLLPGMEDAVERILAAVDAGERVALYGDYDVDGVTSVTLLTHLLRAYGIEPGRQLPRRLTEGYGLTRAGLERCLAELNPQLLIAVDCGTNSREEVEWLDKKGVDVVILDHHEPSPSMIAPAAALVNPKCGDRFGYFCSAGIVFKLAHALIKRRRPEGFDLRELVDIVALGTVADIVPLKGENRTLVRKGLQYMGHTRHIGVAALKEVATVPDKVLASHVGFRLGPRINAAGRIDNADVALELMLEEDWGKALEIARVLDGLNSQRQGLERKIASEARAQVEEVYAESDPACIVVAGRGWHSGVVGIVASRIVREYYRPTLVIGIDEDGNGKGSGRSVPRVDLHAALEQCRHYLVAGGGHEQAVGVSLKEEDVPAFRKAMDEAVRAAVAPDDLVPKITMDTEVSLGELSMGWLDQFEKLEPFGAENPQPLLLVRRVMPVEERRLKDKHLKLTLEDERGATQEAIYFSAPDQLPGAPWDVAFTVDRNEFRGRATLQLLVRAIRTSE